ncbi:effector-associated domain EAD1-containing protein [Saccharothrix sp. NPDC042600]|uniref:effector-associated domain EAD1-containing protein n=1 Tax=Saccharothrix TaxID=2071 RepID=UPI0034023FF8|nr:hypothetical protein GCM10017745_73600 [Saccharothrix mutabilis subsp. capreolus]
MRQELARDLAAIFDTEEPAREFLREAGYPASRIPPFTSNARAFWLNVVGELERGIMANGPEAVVRTALSWYPDNDLLAKWLAELTGGAAETPQDTPTTAGSATATEAGPRLEDSGPCFVLYAITSDQHSAFVDAVRAVAGPEAELLYTTPHVSAVRIPDPGQRADQMVAAVQQELSQRGSNATVNYERHPFRPYLIASLVVQGPDGQPYELRAVPASTLVSDIPFAVLSQYDDEAVRNRRGEFPRTVVDVVGADGQTRRLDPNQTLHEAGVRDGDAMQVAAQATAGSTQRWQQWVERASAQIEAYARRHDEFDIVKTNSRQLPTQFTIRITTTGFALPEDADPYRPEPVEVGQHEVLIALDREFPREAPLVLWQSPVFHPNIARLPGPLPKGAVCLGALMDAYRPDLDFAELCGMLVDIAGYRNYEVLDPDEEGEGYFDRQAARWARSAAGQDAIEAIGGRRVHELARETADHERAPMPLTVRAWGVEG